MTRPYSKARFATSLSLLLLMLLALPASASELKLRPFSASYDLYKGGMHVAITEFKLERSGSDWRFRLLTRARGVFSWFTDKQPFAETTFSVSDDEILLREIVAGDASADINDEAARFDWGASTVDVMRKGKRRQFELEGGVYDYQSIHLFAASMQQRQLKIATVDFYRNGKLDKAQVLYSGDKQVEVNGERIDANVFEQKLSRSTSKMRYFYDVENPVLPLRIEKHESGKSASVLALRDVEWGL